MLQGKLLKQASLAPYTSWRTGGHAEYVYLPANVDDLASFLQQLALDVPVTWLGLGSNTLIREGGVEGVVIITQGKLNQLTHIPDKEIPRIRVEAGVSCAQLARYSARLGFSGLEFMAGIPGTVGGALAMNAGCYGGETWQTVHAVETLDRTGKHRVRPVADFTVSYRHVIRPAQEWFIAGHFIPKVGQKEHSLEEIRCLLEKRNASQPTGTANCGSVFRNPPGNYAARLIEQCGLKGKKKGGACVSEKHANFIINENNASAADIEALINEVADQVAEKTGIRLVTEVCIIGKM